MPRKFLRRLAPPPQKLRAMRALKPLGEWIYEPKLWHITRSSTAMAFAIGLFCAMIPIPGQVFVAAFFAVRLGANLPISVTLIWITNPLTMPVIYYLAYKLGAFLLGTPLLPIEFTISWHWLINSLGAIWAPFLLGCGVMGLICGLLGWLTVNTLWRLRVARDWHKRRRRSPTS